MLGYFYERINAEQKVTGLILVVYGTPIGVAINDLELLIGAGEPEELENRVNYVPLK